MKKIIITILSTLVLFGGSLTANAAVGDLLIGTANPNINTRLPIGSNLTCLISNGTTPGWSTCSGGGGGGGAGTFSTTSPFGTTQVQYPAFSPTVTSLDTSATSTSKIYFDPAINKLTLASTTCIFDGTDCTYFNGNYHSFDRGLVAYYPLNEAAGTTAYDHSTNANNATGSGSYGFDTSFFNQGLYLNGASSDFFSAPATSYNSGLAQITTSIWWYSTTTPTGTNQLMFGKHLSGTNGEWFLFFTGANTIEFSTINSSLSRVNLTAGVGNKGFDGQWHNAVGTYNGSVMSVYVDGFLLATSSQTGNLQNTTNNLNIGTLNGGGFNYKGNLANARYYNRALSATEVSQLFKAEQPIAGPYTFKVTPIISLNTGTSTFAGDIIANTLNTSSTTATSTFANGINLTKGCVSILGTCITGGGTGSGTVTSVGTNNGLTGGTITTTGTLGLDLSKIANNTLLYYNGTQLQSSTTPTGGNFIATSTTASTFPYASSTAYTSSNYYTASNVKLADSSNIYWPIAGTPSIALDKNGDIMDMSGNLIFDGVNEQIDYPSGGLALADGTGNLYARNELFDHVNSSGSNGNVLTVNSGGFPVWLAPTGSGGVNTDKFATSTGEPNAIYTNTSQWIGVASSTPWGMLSVSSLVYTPGNPDFVISSTTGSGLINFPFVVTAEGDDTIGTSTSLGLQCQAKLCVQNDDSRTNIVKFLNNSGSPQFTLLNTGNATFSSAVNASSFSSGLGTSVNAGYRLNTTGTGLYSPATNNIGFTTNANSAGVIDATQKWGIGTTTPFAHLSVSATSSTDVSPLFAVATSSGQASTTIYMIDSKGHQITGGFTPTISGGTSSVAGNDNNGTITVTGVALTSVTLTFANAWASAPDCQESDNSTAITADVTSISTTQVVFGFSAGINSGTIWYKCTGHF